MEILLKDMEKTCRFYGWDLVAYVKKFKKWYPEIKIIGEERIEGLQESQE